MNKVQFANVKKQVKAPWVKTFFYGELDTYIIPGFNGTLTLGGSRNFDSENMKVCPYELAAIRQRCENFLPALKTAEVVKNEVGLRPHRENNVRVEIEEIVNGYSKAIVSFGRISFISMNIFVTINETFCVTASTQLWAWRLWSVHCTWYC